MSNQYQESILKAKVVQADFVRRTKSRKCRRVLGLPEQEDEKSILGKGFVCAEEGQYRRNNKCCSFMRRWKKGGPPHTIEMTRKAVMESMREEKKGPMKWRPPLA